MDQATLHKYFQGNASTGEEERILRWVDESEENMRRFKKERFLYDVALFHNNRKNEKAARNKRILHTMKWTLRIAASILVILSCGVLVNEYMKSTDIQIQTVTVPAGQRTHIALADGTRIWLNAKSTLKYDISSFGKKERTVELDGEAYFEVAKDTRKPFYVLTERNKIGVVGTSFNINAYKGSDVFETVLVEGIVDVYEGNSTEPLTRLNKNELYTSNQEGAKVKKVVSQDYLTWKDGIYSFDDEPFKGILHKLEKYYNVKFKIENTEIMDYRITGKFREQDGVEHVLKTIQKDHKFVFAIDKETNVITIK